MAEYKYDEIKDIHCDIGTDSDCVVQSSDDEETQSIKKIRQKEIDDLTLKLLTNHGKFNKYLSLSVNDHAEEERRREIQAKGRFFRERIIDYTAELLDNINSASNIEIRDNFNNYIYSVIKHLEYDTALKDGEDVVRDDMEPLPSRLRRHTTVAPIFSKSRGLGALRPLKGL